MKAISSGPLWECNGGGIVYVQVALDKSLQHFYFLKPLDTASMLCQASCGLAVSLSVGSWSASVS